MPPSSWPPCNESHRAAVAFGALTVRPMQQAVVPCMPPASVLSPRALGHPLAARATPEEIFADIVLPRLLHDPPQMVVDVGAHKGGTFAALASRAGHAGVAFEPGPENCAELRVRTAAMLRQAKRRWRLPWQPPKPASLLVRCVAVGATPSAVRFASSARSDSSSIARGHGNRTRGISVPVVRLDDELFTDAAVAPGSFPNQYDHRAGIVLKSDTQGFELEVLRGARRLMAQRAIALLFVEVSSSLLRNQGTSALRLMHWIRMRGYDCAHLRLAARVTPKGRSPVRFSVIDLPAPLLGRATIGFDELARVLQHAPPANMSGWTDLVCWPARIL